MAIESESSEEHLLDIEDLKVTFDLEEGILKAVDGSHLSIRKRKVVGLVGESGCGKSVTAHSILRLISPPGKIEGRILLHERGGARINPPLDLVALHDRDRILRDVRGNDIAMIFQEPMAAFSPIHTIGEQASEPILLHRTRNKKEARAIAIEMLSKVGISNPAQRIDEYPHQLSGGMRQRAMIAIALSCNPALLIADEPTTALDVTVQAQVLDLLQSLQSDLGMSMLYITHDLGVLAEIADEVAVMYLGQIAEHATTEDLFYDPLHPYTQALLESIPTTGMRKANQRLSTISGSVPVPIGLPVGCPFYDRCPKAMDGLCNAVNPPLVEVKPRHKVACFLYPEVEEAASGAAGLRSASQTTEPHDDE